MNLFETIRDRFDAGAHLPPRFTGDSLTIDGLPHAAAAVLAAITDRTEPGLILTKRNESLRNHPGQIAFAGGRSDPEDDGPIDTALREAKEEIGMPRGAVEIVGCDPALLTHTGFRIIPVIGIVPPDLPLVPLEFEVEDIFEVPLAHVLDPANQIRRETIFAGRTREYHEIIWQDRRIWGVTAALIINLSRWLRG